MIGNARGRRRLIVAMASGVTLVAIIAFILIHVFSSNIGNARGEAALPQTVRSRAEENNLPYTLIQNGALTAGILLSAASLVMYARTRRLRRRLNLRNAQEEQASRNLIAENTELKAKMEEINRMAFTNQVTGLPNLQAFLCDVEDYCQTHDHPNLYMLYMDLDNFKDINDTYGHDLGNRALRAMAERLQENEQTRGQMFNFGGDGFTILMEAESDAQVARVAQTMMEAVKKPIFIEENEFHLTASTGIANSRCCTNVRDLVKYAEAAMYRAKKNNQLKYQFFNEEIGEAVRDRIRLQNSLRRALEQGEFELYYQPQVRADSGELTGFEALLRWNHPERGLVLPGEFIRQAEESRMIVPIGLWVLRSACQFIHDLNNRFGTQYRIAVNVAIEQLMQPDYDTLVMDTLRENGLEPSLLELEITESSLLNDTELVIEKIRTLSEEGIRIALDDFGTGYSSLRYLMDLPVHVLKIDRYFISRIGEQKSQTLIQTMVHVGHALGMKLVAEGVETAQELSMTAELHCDLIQGYFTGRPVPARDIIARVQNASQDRCGGNVGIASQSSTMEEGSFMATVHVHASCERGRINRNLFGHFSEHLGRCIYQGLFVGEDSPIPNVAGMRCDVVDALRRIHIPVLRWPGGCFADEYHWRDGVGPKAERKRMVNTNWGYVVEDNTFGTHEFMELCRQLGCEPYVNGNLGSGTVREMAEWVEYLNSDGDSSVVRERKDNGSEQPFGVTYFGVGNESWGCGGNMRPEYYADEYRRYQTYCRDYGENKLCRIACGPSDEDYRWTEVLMQNAARFMDALSLHSYTWVGPEWSHKGSATQFTQDAYYAILRKAGQMERIIANHLAVMHRYDPEHRIGLIVDEWGTWFDVESGTNPGFLYQQNTMRDALVAAINLNAFIRHCDRVVMANLAQTVNVLQAMVLTEGDRMVLTPTYHVFDLYQAHQDAQAVECLTETDTAAEGVPAALATASVKNGVLTVTLANTSADRPIEVNINITGLGVSSAVGRVLTGAMDAFNDFDHDRLNIQALKDVELREDGLRVLLPACAVAEITCR